MCIAATGFFYDVNGGEFSGSIGPKSATADTKDHIRAGRTPINETHKSPTGQTTIHVRCPSGEALLGHDLLKLLSGHASPKSAAADTSTIKIPGTQT